MVYGERSGGCPREVGQSQAREPRCEVSRGGCFYLASYAPAESPLYVPGRPVGWISRIQVRHEVFENEPLVVASGVPGTSCDFSDAEPAAAGKRPGVAFTAVQLDS